MLTPYRHFFLLILFFSLSGFNEIIAASSSIPVDSLIKKAASFHRQGLDYDKTNPVEAIKNYNAALQLRLQVYKDYKITDENILEGIIKGYFNIADSWKGLGNVEQAAIYLDSCWSIHLAFEQLHCFYSHRRRGQFYHLKGQLYNATASWEPTMESYLNAATHFSLASKSEDWRNFQQAKILNDISSLFINWRMSADSILRYGQNALHIYQGLLNSPFSVQEEIAIVKTNIGTAYEMKGQFKQANQYYREAVQLLEELKAEIEEDMGYHGSENAPRQTVDAIVNFGPLVEKLNDAYNGWGITLTGSGQFDQAKVVLNKAIDLNQQLRNLPDTKYLLSEKLLAKSHNNLADVYFKMGDYTKALEDNQRAVELITKDFASVEDQYGNPDINHPDLFLHDKLLFLNAILDKTKCLVALGQAELAIATANTGIDFIYKIRSNYEDLVSRFRLAEYLKVLTEELLHIYLQRENPAIDQAFYYAEKSKTYTLLDAIKGQRILRVGGLDETLLVQERKLRKEIGQLEESIVSSTSQEDKVELLAMLSQKRKILQSLLTTLQENPDYQRLFAGVAPVSISYIQRQLLADDQALIEYFTGVQGTYIFCIPKKGKARYYYVPIPEKKLEAEVDDFLTALLFPYQGEREDPSGLSKQKSRRELQRQWFEKGQSLFKLCLADLQNDYPSGRLLVVPDGPLNKLSFSALIRPDSQAVFGAYHTYDYAGLTYDIGYCYSATLLAEMQQLRTANSTDVLAFAPSFSGRNDDQKSGFSHLIYNEIEVEEICQTYDCGTPPLIGENALKQTFLALVENNPYYALHLSTHGKANYADPDRSFISFSQSQKGVINQDQLFYLRELYNIELAVEMVVLSSCETNVGFNHRAGGLVSMTRGFAFAGAKSVVSSLWAVDDRATKELMTLFYKNLHSGLSKDRALQSAKKSLIRDGSFSHPYYWAAFIPIGKMQEQSVYSYNYWFFMGIGLVLLGGIFGLNYFRSSSKSFKI